MDKSASLTVNAASSWSAADKPFPSCVIAKRRAQSASGRPNATMTYVYSEKFRKGKGSDVPAEVTVRGLGHWNLGLAVLLFADASDLRGLVALSHYIVVLNLLGDIPANDALDAPHAPIVVLMAVFGALGYGTSRGVVPLWIAAASAIGNGLQFFLTPKSAWKAYGADGKGVSKRPSRGRALSAGV